MRTPLRTTLLILLVTSLLAGARSARSSQAGQSFSQSENVPLAAPDPLACSGYAEPRLFLDTQAGWITTPGKAGANHGQIQIATCFPLNQTVTGVVPLDLRLTMHDNPGQLVSLAVQVFTDSGETVIAKQSFSPALTCQGTCEFWVHVDADTTQVPYDGRQEWRIRARVNEPDGKALSSSTNWQTYLANGKPLNHYRNYDLLKGKSTHNDSSVAARLDSGYPLAPVTEPFTVRFRCEADGPAISECLVAVDSDFDKGNPGVILYQTTSSSEEPRALTIDPAQFPAGAHRLVVRASANHSIGSTNVGMLGLPFTVVGGAGPTNTPTATQTAAATQTQTQAATDTPVLDATGTPAPTFTQTSAPAQTDTPTSTQILTPTFTRTQAATITRTPSATRTPAFTASPTRTATFTRTPTWTPTVGPTTTRTPVPTSTTPPSSGSIRFAVIGDYGSNSTAERDVANLVKSWNPDFVITTGDNNYDSGAASTIDRNIGQYYHEFIFPYTGSYGAGATTNRFFPSLGNHDWGTSGAQPYRDYFTLPGNERYYEFVWGPVHFFAIDSDSHEPDGTSSTSTQANWLRTRLAAAAEPWKIVYFHHPAYSSGNHGSSSWMRWPFKAWGATTVMAGHDHLYERLSVDGLPYFTNGAGGRSLYAFRTILPESQRRFNSDYGAMRVDASASQITFRFITRAGTVIETFTLTSPASSTAQETQVVAGESVSTTTHVIPAPTETPFPAPAGATKIVKETAPASATKVPLDTPTPAETKSLPTLQPSPTTGPGGIAPYPDAPLCADSGAFGHDNSLFHTIWDAARGCHYDHEHGQDPFTAEVADVFPGFDLYTSLGNVEVGHTNPSGPMENTHKHGGFKWNVQLIHPQACQGFEGAAHGVNGSVVQYHNFGDYALELETRIHSTVALMRQCNVVDPLDYGYVFVNQFQDYGQIVVPYQGTIFPHPHVPVPAYDSARGPYLSVNCIGPVMQCRESLEQAGRNNASSNWTSKPTGVNAAHPFGSTLFTLLFRIEDTYQNFWWEDQTYPFTLLYICSADEGQTYNPVGCAYNNSTTQVHEIAGEIPEAWDGLAGFDTDVRVGRITGEGYVTRFGDLNGSPTPCSAAGPDCHPIKMVGAFVGRYGSVLVFTSGKGVNIVPKNPERDIYFCNGVVCAEGDPGAVASGWIGQNN